MTEECVWAVKNADIEGLDNIQDANATFKGRPLLVTAADFGHTEVIKFLIKKGANVNSADNMGITPLLAAIWENHVNAVKVLLDNGAKKDGKCPNGTSYLEAAVDEDIKKLLK